MVLKPNFCAYGCKLRVLWFLFNSKFKQKSKNLSCKDFIIFCRCSKWQNPKKSYDQGVLCISCRWTQQWSYTILSPGDKLRRLNQPSFKFWLKSDSNASFNQYFQSEFVIGIRIVAIKFIKLDSHPIKTFKSVQKLVKFNC